MADLRELKELIARKSNEDLYSYFAAASDYTQETLDAVRDEIRIRRLPEDRLDELAAAARSLADARLNMQDDNTYRFNGIGTTLLGRREFRDDGTFITTMWFTLAFIPIFPIRSLRIKKASSGGFIVYERLKLHWKQVIYTFLFVPLSLLWLFLAGALSDSITQAGHINVGFSLLFASFFVPPCIPFILRYRAKKECITRR